MGLGTLLRSTGHPVHFGWHGLYISAALPDFRVDGAESQVKFQSVLFSRRG
jgi:hypothetical protein